MEYNVVQLGMTKTACKVGASLMKSLLAFVEDVYEDLELWYPKIRLEEEGWEVISALVLQKT
jgi:hypothetical protein